MNAQLTERFVRKFRKSELIFCQYETGDSLYLLQKGKVELLVFDNGIEKTLGILNEGDYLGETAVLESKPRSASAVALTDVVALEINRNNFQQILKNNTNITKKLIVLFCKRVMEQRRRQLVFTMPDTTGRVADVIMMLYEIDQGRFSSLLNDGFSSLSSEPFTITADFEEIAHWAGITLVECRQAINELVGHLKMTAYNDRLTIPNARKLYLYIQEKKEQAEFSL